MVEAVTKSRFGSNTVIFVIEDDPQSGYDHVDAHRSLCLVISPYTKRGQVISTFYNQAGVLHTMEQIMGLPPMNQQDAMAPLMFDCFTNVPNFTPYTALPNNVDLAAGTGGSATLSPKQKYWARKLQKMDFTKPDRSTRTPSTATSGSLSKATPPTPPSTLAATARASNPAAWS